MARLPRLDLPRIPQHVVQRGNNRLPCSLDDGDHGRYVRLLREAMYCQTATSRQPVPIGNNSVLWAKTFARWSRPVPDGLRGSAPLILPAATLVGKPDPVFAA